MLDCWTEAETPGLKEIFDVEDQALVRRIVAIDETWIRELEPELKSQSNEWRATGSLGQKILTSSIKGQANYDLCLWSPRSHHDRWSPMWKKCHWSLLLCFMQKLWRKVHKNRPRLLMAGLFILHDNARPHIADVVTKNFAIMVGKCYLMHPTVQTWIL